MSGKLKNSKNKNVSIVIRKLQGEIPVKFRNFSETTTGDAGNADKKPGERTRRDQRNSKKGSAVSRGALMMGVISYASVITGMAPAANIYAVAKHPLGNVHIRIASPQVSR